MKKKFTIKVEDVTKKLETSDDEEELRSFLSEDLFMRLRKGEIQARNKDGYVVYDEYIPFDGDVVTFSDNIKPCSFDVVANRYGETLSFSEYVVLREKLQSEGFKLWDLHVEVARELISSYIANVTAMEDLLSDEQEIERYKGQHIVFVDGKLVDYDRDKDKLEKRVDQIYLGKNRHYTYIPLPDEPVLNFKTRSGFR